MADDASPAADSEKADYKWRAFAKSVRGSTHVRRGLPNQDYAGLLPEEREVQPCPCLVVAVADGHGSAKCVRSQLGSQFAVAAAKNVCKEHLQPNGQELSSVKRLADEGILPRNIVLEWRRLVEEHCREHPFTAEERDAMGLPHEDPRSESDAETQSLWSAYGATLLVVIVTADFILYLQLGDGDIVTVADNGHVVRPIPGDRRLIANETTSLSGNQSRNDFRVNFQTLVQSPPALILLATDGYSNSFQTDQGFLKVAPDILNLIVDSGFEAVEHQMEGWLEETSTGGSGDDVTVVVVYRAQPTPTQVTPLFGDSPAKNNAAAAGIASESMGREPELLLDSSLRQLDSAAEDPPSQGDQPTGPSTETSGDDSGGSPPGAADRDAADNRDHGLDLEA